MNVGGFANTRNNESNLTIAPTGLEDSSHNPPSKQAGIAVSGSMKAIYYRRKKTPARAVIIRKAKAMVCLTLDP